MTNGATEKVTLRLTPELVKRAEALQKKLSKDPRHSSLGKVTHSMILKLAIARGLESLESEYK